jgi:hypothetical protein
MEPPSAAGAPPPSGDSHDGVSPVGTEEEGVPPGGSAAGAPHRAHPLPTAEEEDGAQAAAGHGAAGGAPSQVRPVRTGAHAMSRAQYTATDEVEALQAEIQGQRSELGPSLAASSAEEGAQLAESMPPDADADAAEPEPGAEPDPGHPQPRGLPGGSAQDPTQPAPPERRNIAHLLSGVQPQAPQREPKAEGDAVSMSPEPEPELDVGTIEPMPGPEPKPASALEMMAPIPARQLFRTPAPGAAERRSPSPAADAAAQEAPPLPQPDKQAKPIDAQSAKKEGFLARKKREAAEWLHKKNVEAKRQAEEAGAKPATVKQDYLNPSFETALKVKAGAAVSVLNTDNADWWKVSVRDPDDLGAAARVGFVPASYLQLTEDTEVAMARAAAAGFSEPEPELEPEPVPEVQASLERARSGPPFPNLGISLAGLESF